MEKIKKWIGIIYFAIKFIPGFLIKVIYMIIKYGPNETNEILKKENEKLDSINAELNRILFKYNEILKKNRTDGTDGT